MPASRSKAGGDPADDILLGQLYDVAVEPERYAELLQEWEARRKGSGGSGLAQLGGFGAHLDRAERLLERLSSEEARAGAENLPEDAAAFVIAPGGVISAMNAEAQKLFPRLAAMHVSALPLAPDERAEFADTAERLISGASAGRPMLRLRPASGRRVIIVQLSLGRSAPRRVIAVTTEIAWPRALDAMLRGAFGVSQAETDVLRALAQGQTVTEIAELRGTAVLTVRSQVRALLGKTGARSQGELLRLTIGLMDMARQEPAAPEPAEASATRFNEWQRITLKDGRLLDYLSIGARGGRAFLWLPSAIGMARFLPDAERALAARGLTMIVPARAGYGFSSPAPKGRPVFETAARDLDELMLALGIARCPAASLGQDFCAAAHFAAAFPGRVSALIACAPVMPPRGAKDYERMHVWQRFIAANARYAPKALPFLVRAGFALARRAGKQRFGEMVFGNCPADIAALRDPELMETMLLGSEATLSSSHSAHEAFAAEVLAINRDWSHLLAAVKAPVTLFAGHDDAEAPIATVREFAAQYPAFRLIEFPGEGRLAAFTHWRELLDVIDASAG